MPKRTTPGTERIEFTAPSALLAALRTAAEAVGMSLAEYLLRAGAKRAGVKYAPRGRGRPKKTPG